MAINDINANQAFQMDVTVSVNLSTTMDMISRMIVSAANKRPDGKFKNLILTAHGRPGHFYLGSGLNINTMGPFIDIRDKVDKIWFRGCLIGRTMGPETARQGDGKTLAALGITNGDGHLFLSQFSYLTGAYVVAPTEMQSSLQQRYPHGQLDSYEGLLLCYNPEGNVSWRRRYPSMYRYTNGGRNGMNPNGE